MQQDQEAVHGDRGGRGAVGRGGGREESRAGSHAKGVVQLHH